MRTIQIDFARQTLRKRLLQLTFLNLLLFLLATFFIGQAAIQTLGLYQKSSAAQAKINTKRHELVKAERQAQRSKLSSTTLAVSLEKADAINPIIGQLNLPWSELVDALEAVDMKDVSILQLEPDVRRKILKVSAESKALADMFAFVERLNRQALFQNATLLKHEVNEQDTNKPIRFQVEVQWKVEVRK